MSKPKFEIGENLAFVILAITIFVTCIVAAYLESHTK